MIEDLQSFADAPRMAVITGKQDAGYLRSYDKNAFEGIDRVVVSAANPLLNTTAGKINLADQLLQNGMLPGGESGAMKYIQLINTGRMEPETQALQSEYMAINSDKEMLLAGKMPIIQLTDNHPLRMQEVNALNNNPIIRENPNLGNMVRQYIMAHFQQWLQMPPLLAAAMGIQPPPPQGAPPGGASQPEGPKPPQQGAPHPPGQPGQPQHPVHGGVAPAAAGGAPNPIQAAGQQVKMPQGPNMPQKAPPQMPLPAGAHP
jgi:hypothetical protein